jgi:3-oxoacyl-[acyl-carrier protein] reductase
LLLVGRNESKLESLSRELGHPFEAVDVTNTDEMSACLQNASFIYGKFDGFVNCVGSIVLKPAHLTSDAEFDQTLRTNLYSSFAILKSAIPLLREHGGSLVFFASAAAEIGIANHEAIAAAKAGVIGLARSAAATYALQNIRVNVISPGLIKTEMTRRIWDVPANCKASTEMHALQRLGEPAHIASLVSWLLNPENDWITGQVIGVDGGLGHILPRR